MAVTKAIARYVRVSPRKTRQIIDLIRGRDVSSAEAILGNMNKRGARIVIKVLKSAISNAENNYGLKKENLYVSKIFADQGPMLKRYKSAPFGRPVMIRKRTSHITIELDVKEKK
jgi:large subunit ribosomal protein L22